MMLVAGPRLDVEVSVTTERAQEIVKRSDPVPRPQIGHALLDTGATRTCVDIEAINALQVPAVDQVQVMTPSGSEIQTIHPVRLAFLGTGLGAVETIPVLASKLAGQGILALIGRDILARCVLVYNGPGGFFTLTA